MSSPRPDRKRPNFTAALALFGVVTFGLGGMMVSGSGKDLERGAPALIAGAVLLAGAGVRDAVERARS